MENNKIYSFKNIQLQLIENNIFISKKDIEILLNINEKLLDLWIISIKQNQLFEEKNNIYSLNTIFSIALENNCKNNLFPLFNFLKNNSLDIYLWDFIIDIYNNNDESLLKCLNNYEDIIYSYNKLSQKHLILHKNYEINYLENDDLNKIKNYVINYFSLNKNFGEEKLYDIDLIDNLLSKYLPEKTIETIEEFACYILYSIIKEQPFKQNNKEMAILITSYFLNKNKLLIQDNIQAISLSDLLLAAEIIDNSNLDEKDKTIEKISKLLQFTPSKNNEFSQLLMELKNDPTEENIINYITKYIEKFNYITCYYGYFDSPGRVYRINYSANYKKFTLNIFKTMNNNKTMYFDIKAIAFIQSPTNLNDRKNMINNLYHEIKTRSYDDIINNVLIQKLKDDLKDIYDLNKINFKFNISWSIDIDENIIY